MLLRDREAEHALAFQEGFDGLDYVLQGLVSGFPLTGDAQHGAVNYIPSFLGGFQNNAVMQFHHLRYAERYYALEGRTARTH